MNNIYSKHELILIILVSFIALFMICEFPADILTTDHVTKIETILGRDIESYENKIRYELDGELCTFQISKECSAVYVISILMILISGTPNVSIIRKIIYIPISFMMLWTVNTFRIVLNFELSPTKEIFIIFHGIISQLIMFFVMLLVFYIWLNFSKIEKEEENIMKMSDKIKKT